MNRDNIRVKVICLLIREGKALASKGLEVSTGQHFYRVLGGSLEFGGTWEEGVRREIREEQAICMYISRQQNR